MVKFEVQELTTAEWKYLKAFDTRKEADAYRRELMKTTHRGHYSKQNPQRFIPAPELRVKRSFWDHP
jgi:hypothetical protein